MAAPTDADIAQLPPAETALNWTPTIAENIQAGVVPDFEAEAAGEPALAADVAQQVEQWNSVFTGGLRPLSAHLAAAALPSATNTFVSLPFHTPTVVPLSSSICALSTSRDNHRTFALEFEGRLGLDSSCQIALTLPGDASLSPMQRLMPASDHLTVATIDLIPARLFENQPQQSVLTPSSRQLVIYKSSGFYGSTESLKLVEVEYISRPLLLQVLGSQTNTIQKAYTSLVVVPTDEDAAARPPLKLGDTVLCGGPINAPLRVWHRWNSATIVGTTSDQKLCVKMDYLADPSEKNAPKEIDINCLLRVVEPSQVLLFRPVVEADIQPDLSVQGGQLFCVGSSRHDNFHLRSYIAVKSVPQTVEPFAAPCFEVFGADSSTWNSGSQILATHNDIVPVVPLSTANSLFVGDDCRLMSIEENNQIIAGTVTQIRQPTMTSEEYAKYRRQQARKDARAAKKAAKSNSANPAAATATSAFSFGTAASSTSPFGTHNVFGATSAFGGSAFGGANASPSGTTTSAFAFNWNAPQFVPLTLGSGATSTTTSLTIGTELSSRLPRLDDITFGQAAPAATSSAATTTHTTTASDTTVGLTTPAESSTVVTDASPEVAAAQTASAATETSVSTSTTLEETITVTPPNASEPLTVPSLSPAVAEPVEAQALAASPTAPETTAASAASSVPQVSSRVSSFHSSIAHDPLENNDAELAVGMYLEAVDLLSDELTVGVARITEVHGNDITVTFSEQHSQVLQLDSDMVHPIGWCAAHNTPLITPSNVIWHGWRVFLQLTVNATPAPMRVFTHPVNQFERPQFPPLSSDQQNELDDSDEDAEESEEENDRVIPYADRVLTQVQPGMRLEAVDRQNRHLTCVANIQRILDDGTVEINFDGWSARYDYIADLSSDDLHPIGYCQVHNLVLQPPRGDQNNWRGWTSYLESIAEPPVPVAFLTSPTNADFVRPDVLTVPVAPVAFSFASFGNFSAPSNESRLDNFSKLAVRLRGKANGGALFPTSSGSETWVYSDGLLLDPRVNIDNLPYNALNPDSGLCILRTYNRSGGIHSTAFAKIPSLKQNSDFVLNFNCAADGVLSIDMNGIKCKFNVPTPSLSPDLGPIIQYQSSIQGVHLLVKGIDDQGERIRDSIMVWNAGQALCELLLEATSHWLPNRHSIHHAAFTESITSTQEAAAAVRSAKDDLTRAAMQGLDFVELQRAYETALKELRSSLTQLTNLETNFQGQCQALRNDCERYLHALKSVLSQDSSLITTASAALDDELKTKLSNNATGLTNRLQCVQASSAELAKLRTVMTEHACTEFASTLRWNTLPDHLLPHVQEIRQGFNAAYNLLFCAKLHQDILEAFLSSFDTQTGQHHLKLAIQLREDITVQLLSDTSVTETLLKQHQLAGVRHRLLECRASILQLRTQHDLSILFDEPETVVSEQQIALDDSNVQLKELEQKAMDLQALLVGQSVMLTGAPVPPSIRRTGLVVLRDFAKDYKVLKCLSALEFEQSGCAVYQAHYGTEVVAVKRVSLASEQLRLRFEREIVTRHAMHDHPTIAPIEAVFYSSDCGFIQTPYYADGDIESWLSAQPRSLWDLQRVLRSILQALDHMHERGFLHRDLQLSNVLITKRNEPVLVGFSVSKAINKTPQNVARKVLTRGQSTYDRRQYGFEAPEVEEGKAQTAASDMWSFGALVLYLHTKRLPAVIDNKVILPGTPEGRLENLLVRLLTINPKFRPSAAQVLCDPFFTSSHADDMIKAKRLVSSEEKLLKVKYDVRNLANTPEIREVLGQSAATGGFSFGSYGGTNLPTHPIIVSRARLVEDVFNIVRPITGAQLCGSFNVRFTDEMGVDQGGLKSDLYTSFFEQATLQLFDEHGLPLSSLLDEPSTLLRYEIFGRMMAKSIIDDRQINLKLPNVIFKFLLDEKPVLGDLEDHLGERLHNLRYILEHGSQEENDDGRWADWKLTFNFNGDMEEPVTDANKELYIELYVWNRLVAPHQEKLKKLREGMYSCPNLRKYLSTLTSEELIVLICGLQELTAPAVLDSMDFINFPPESNTPEHLKALLMTYSDQQLRKFLRLCTGRTTMPASGWKDPMCRIKVARFPESALLPVGHTCSHQLDLPDYNNANVLEEKFEIAIESVAGSGFLMA